MFYPSLKVLNNSELYVNKINKNTKNINNAKSSNANNNYITNVSFTSGKELVNNKVEIAETALKKMCEHINNGTNLTEEDKKWLHPLKKSFGADEITVNNPDSPKKEMTVDCDLSIEKINKDKESFASALKTMISATKYTPEKLQLDGKNYTVHNKSIAGMMKSDYTKDDFLKIKKYLNNHHVFDMTDNHSYGLVIDKERSIAKTCGAAENWEMSDRAWITDTVRVGDLQKDKRPETWTKALNTLGNYYETQKENFDTLINNPELYRNGDPMQGIPHIFMPKTLDPDVNWFNNKRLESHGLALKEFSSTIIDGLTKNAKYGYKKASNIPDNILLAMDNLSKYFSAIDYSTAPSAGNWEEIPLKGGLTSDTEIIRSALSAYKDLLYGKDLDSNKEVQIIRERLADLSPLSEDKLNELIEQGKSRVRETYLEESPNVRPYDSSLAFVTTSDIKLADSIFEDVKKHVEILDMLEDKLVRENGIIRYAPFNFTLKDGTTAQSPDSYLNLNYFNAIDKNGHLNLDWKNILDNFGSKDCSDPDMFFARAKLSTPDKEAQWFMVSEMSTGYGKQLEKLINNAQKENRDLTNEEKELALKLKKKQTEYLNRALARISDENPDKINQIKANGMSMPPVTVSEAHQYVSDLYGHHKMLQGTNAPLAWALASLYKAIKQEDKTLNM